MSQASAPRTRRRIIVGILLAAVALVALLWFTRGKDPEAVWASANQAIEARDFERAGRELNLLAKLREPTPNDNLLTAQYLIAIQRPDEAVERLDRIPDDAPAAALARFQAGQVELRRGRVRKAEIKYREAIRLDPQAIRPRRELIYIIGMQSRFRDLSEAFRELGKLVPLTADDVLLWCLSRNLSWSPEEMTSVLRNWLAADPEDLQTRKALAENLFRRQLTAEAEETIKGLSADDPDIREFLAKVLLEGGKIERAEELLNGGPLEHAGLARLRGRLALHKQNASEAVKWLEISRKLDPAHRDTMNSLAGAYLLARQPDKAKEFQELTRRYDRIGPIIEGLTAHTIPRDAAVYKKLGAEYESIGRVEEARAWYSLAIGLAPLDSESQQALFRLKPTEDAAR